MDKYASKVVAQAKAWLGLKESDGSYQVILDTYNSQPVLPRGHKMNTSDAWCAAFVSAVAVKLGYTDIIPTECSCTKMIEKLKAIGSWVESDSYVPKHGDIFFYDWDDSGKGENTDSPEHVGIVEKVENGVTTVIEGNFSNSVKRRLIAVNGKYIRGYGVPKYDAETTAKAETTKKGDYTMEMRNLKKGMEGEDVRALQILLIGRGYSCGNSGADGIFGNDTHSAVCRYQKAKSLEVDGIAGPETMGSLLGV